MYGEYILIYVVGNAMLPQNYMARAEILNDPQSLYRYPYRFTVCDPQLSSLQLSKLHSFLETVYQIKKEIPSCERRCIERGSSQSKRNSINPYFRFSPRYYIHRNRQIYAIIFLEIFRKSRKSRFLILFTFFKKYFLPISEFQITVRIIPEELYTK